MIERLRTQPHIFLWIMAAYFVLNFLVRQSLPDSLELDEAQQSLLSQWLALGYDTQPPLYNWVQYAVSRLFGNSVATISALKNAFLFGTYVTYFLTARLLLKDAGLALIAAAGLLTIPQIAWESQRDLTHSVALNFAAVLFYYTLFSTLNRPSLWNYTVAGLAVGIGLLSKYNFALLVASAFVAVLASRTYRARLFDPRVLITIAAAALIVLPHGLWLFGHLEAASSGTLSKLTASSETGYIAQVATGLLSLVTAIAGFAGLTVLVNVIVFRAALAKALMAGDKHTALVERIILVFLAALLAMTLFAGVDTWKDRWLSPVLLILPLYFCMKLQAARYDDVNALRRFLPVAVGVMLVVPLALFARVTAAGWSGTYQKLNVPYGSLAQTLAEEFSSEPSLVVAQDRHLAGNLRLHFPQTQVTTPEYAALMLQYHWSKDKPILLVWRIDDDGPLEVPPILCTWLREKFNDLPYAIRPKALALPYHYGKATDTYCFGYGWVTLR